MPTVMNFSQRILLCFLGAILALGVAGCGSEPKERAAFISFLQTRIVDKPGVHVPTLTAEEEKSFGDYSKHVAVIGDYNKTMDAKLQQPLRDMAGKRMPRTMADLPAWRSDMIDMRKTSVALRKLIDTELAAAGARRVALKQPDDLKAVYDKAYARTVTDPATSIVDMLTAMEGMIDSAEKLTAFLGAHQGQIRFNGAVAEVDDQKVLDEMNALMKDLNASNDKVAAAQRKLNATVTGK
ncbi:DUF3053 domain-containing protein [Massilia atriviolacea]|uniref:DUF3053 domain-containing protein n=1 Tax=Massilia atriviolacea TaxID=2495579 RepID=A0A430HGF2_9BURK|nr:DUF3053 family protein [Massilia atriviolacea]RSZ56599.1 DUF3053 domain-containing protein [Massilia atriviolacea]